MSATVARPQTSQSAHWYSSDGKPMHTIMGKTTGKPRPTTIKDARELDLVPSVTTILKALHKPELQNWIVEQACLAVLTSPRQRDEALDEFVHRILHEEKQQDQERDAAAQRGTDIHQGIADALQGKEASSDLLPWIYPILDHLKPHIIRHCEHPVVGKGYAGTVDLITGESMVDVWDFKTTKKLPEKGSWNEHRLQLAAYAEALEVNGFIVRSTWNIYISTLEPGKFVVWENPDWQETFDEGFEPILRYWQWANDFSKP